MDGKVGQELGWSNKENDSKEYMANYASSEAHEGVDGCRGSEASFIFGAISSNDEQQRKIGNRKWKRAARNKARKVLLKGYKERENEIVHKRGA